MYRPPRDIILLKYSPELLQAILTLRGYDMAYSDLHHNEYLNMMLCDYVMMY
jgi:hypothetical protein